MCAQCNPLYSTVDGTAIGGTQEIKAVITLGSGNNLTAMLSSPDTQIPDNFQLYSGADVNYIPHGLAGSANDLVIYASEGLLISGLAVTYYDPVADVWVGPIAPQLFLTNGSLNWGCWRNFAQVVVPFKCNITLLGAFISEPEEELPGVGDDNVDDVLDPNSDNAVSNKVVTGALNDMSSDINAVAEKLDTVIDALRTGGVGYTVITED
jgi:hypothetical protein